ncbi:short-chain dehydrogenase [Sphingobium sp. SCG-1]|uniref:SDR family NAD(P)-dependent oxidoreductase n=1 Tax=Sphingobium sp. SCG-1 TaxID=2072936 RepID=UPI000CD67A3A|nr:SDR family oxidoreductase [Sphingobium sp. SCG-1]AUW58791.1 short-chain dehydrogenase [Sphingobium sp. SCG-1]
MIGWTLTVNSLQKPEAEGRRTLITASATGIGAILAERAISRGYEVIVSDCDIAAGQALCERLNCRFERCDLAVEAEVVDLVQRVGAVHLLVNNGGVSGPTVPLSAVTSAQWRRVMEVNVTAQFIACREMVPLMLAAGKGGCIINMSSVAAQIAYPCRAPYAASKAAVLGLTAALAREVGRDGIRVNAILPATTRGDRIDRVIAAYGEANKLSLDDAKSHYLTRHADGRLVDPENVADTILFLASDSARSITGQFVRVDGGFQ